MAHNPDLIQRRNIKIHERFRYYRKKNPKWMLCYVIEAVANEFYLTPYTIEKILRTPHVQPKQLELQFA